MQNKFELILKMLDEMNEEAIKTQSLVVLRETRRNILNISMRSDNIMNILELEMEDLEE